MTKFEPATDYFLIRVLETDEAKKYTSRESVNLSHPSATQTDRLELGEIVEVPKNWSERSNPKLGDVVAYQNLASHKLFVGGEERRLVNKEHVLGRYA